MEILISILTKLLLQNFAQDTTACRGMCKNLLQSNGHYWITSNLMAIIEQHSFLQISIASKNSLWNVPQFLTFLFHILFVDNIF